MARVYVGTYAKYNSGSIAGAWLDLDDYSDSDAFHDAARELHKDEADPELMFQDWEDIPEGMISESHIDADLWDWLSLDDDDKNILAAYLANCGSGTIEQARDAFSGTADSEEDFAEQYAEDIGAISDDVKWPYTCIDWEHAARELMYDFFSVSHNGTLYFFHNQ